MTDDREQTAAVLQGRMSWPDAGRCAEALHVAGGRALNRAQAVEVLKQQLPPSRAEGAAFDLVMAGLVHCVAPTSNDPALSERTTGELRG